MPFDPSTRLRVNKAQGRRSVVLLSGGLDSAVSLKLALDAGEVVLALTCDYGQRAARREIEAARAMCRKLGVPHEVVDLPWLGRICRTALTRPGEELPHPEAAELDEPEKAQETARRVWVPNRNGVFVNVAAAYAEALGADTVVCGFNAEEGATFPDNSAEFVEAASGALRLATLSQVRVWSPTQALSKREIVEKGRALGAPLECIWSCYEGGPEHCFQCESCKRLRRALEASGSWEWFAQRHQVALSRG